MESSARCRWTYDKPRHESKKAKFITSHPLMAVSPL